MGTPGTDRQAVRAAAKRRQSRRSAAIATISTIVVVGGLAALVLTSPGWASVHELFYNADRYTDSDEGGLHSCRAT